MSANDFSPTEKWLIDWFNFSGHATPVACGDPRHAPLLVAFNLADFAHALDARILDVTLDVTGKLAMRDAQIAELERQAEAAVQGAFNKGAQAP